MLPKPQQRARSRFKWRRHGFVIIGERRVRVIQGIGQGYYTVEVRVLYGPEFPERFAHGVGAKRRLERFEVLMLREGCCPARHGARADEHAAVHPRHCKHFARIVVVTVYTDGSTMAVVCHNPNRSDPRLIRLSAGTQTRPVL